jgi:hypothetical protein
MSKREPVDRFERVLPTAETLAKLRQPVWQSYPNELVHAAKEIEYAVEIIAGPLKMRAADYHRLPKGFGGDLSPGQIALIHRYRNWCNAMRQERAHIGYIIEIIAMDQPCRFEGLLMSALRLYDKVNYRRRRKNAHAS